MLHLMYCPVQVYLETCDLCVGLTERSNSDPVATASNTEVNCEPVQLS